VCRRWGTDTFVRYQRSSRSASRRSSRAASRPESRPGSPGPSRTRRSSSFVNELSKKLAFTHMSGVSSTAVSSGASTPASTADSGVDIDDLSKKDAERQDDGPEYDEDVFEDEEIDIDAIQVDTSDLTDNSVKILPGVRRMIDSIPKGRYAVATSGFVATFFFFLFRYNFSNPVMWRRQS
jgi:hypothetical protein